MSRETNPTLSPSFLTCSMFPFFFFHLFLSSNDVIRFVLAPIVQDCARRYVRKYTQMIFLVNAFGISSVLAVKKGKFIESHVQDEMKTHVTYGNTRWFIIIIFIINMHRGDITHLHLSSSSSDVRLRYILHGWYQMRFG